MLFRLPAHTSVGDTAITSVVPTATPLFSEGDVAIDVTLASSYPLGSFVAFSRDTDACGASSLLSKTQFTTATTRIFTYFATSGNYRVCYSVDDSYWFSQAPSLAVSGMRGYVPCVRGSVCATGRRLLMRKSPWALHLHEVHDPPHPSFKTWALPQTQAV